MRAAGGLILGGNLARLRGIDIAERRAAIADDGFSREVAANGYRELWSTVLDAEALSA